MFHKQPLKKSLNPLVDLEQLDQLMMELNEQNQELISGGSGKIRPLHDKEVELSTLQRLQDEFATESNDSLSAIALPSFLNQANKAK